MTDEQRTVGDLDAHADVWRCRTFDGAATAVHLDPACPRIKNDPARKDASVLADSRLVCSFCDDETPDPQTGGGPRRLNRALQREDVTDVDQVADAMESTAELDKEAGA